MLLNIHRNIKITPEEVVEVKTIPENYSITIYIRN